MVVHSLAELERALMAELSDAMNEASVMMWQDTQEEVSKFYSQGSPKVYVPRTGTLGNTPDATPVKTSGNTSSFEVYLHQDFGYSTGSFSMLQVLEHAESTHFRAGILGKPKFWHDAQDKMEVTFNDIMSKHFSG